MRILYLITKSEAGGAQTHVAELCRYFSSLGHEVGVLSYPGGWLQSEIERNGAKFLSNKYFSNSLNPINFFKALLKTKELIYDFKPDLVHCHSSAAGVYGRLSVRNKIRTLYTAHGWGFNIGVSWWQKILAILVEKILSSYAQKIICVSQFVKDLAIKYKIAPEEKFEVVLNGVELLPEKFLDNEKLDITFVGRLAEPKDPMLLLKAVEQIKNNFVVNIVGAGPKFSELEKYINSHNLTNVNLLGELDREKTLGVLRNSDVFVLVSKWEGLPITVLEAMSVGLPIISSDVGGVSEAVDANNGILIYNDVVDLKIALKKLIVDKDLRDRMGKNGRYKIQTIFSLEEMLKKINNIYKL